MSVLNGSTASAQIAVALLDVLAAEGNAAARALYEGAGMAPVARYHYRQAN